MFTLHLFHGRVNIDGDNSLLEPTLEDGSIIEGWGFDGPSLEGVTAVHCTYGTMQIVFDNDVNLAAAAKATGWKIGHDEDTLEMAAYDDLVKINRSGRDEFFGDWDLTLTPNGVHIAQG